MLDRRENRQQTLNQNLLGFDWVPVPEELDEFSKPRVSGKPGARQVEVGQ